MRPAGAPRLPADQHADANAKSVAHLSFPSTRMPYIIPLRGSDRLSDIIKEVDAGGGPVREYTVP